MEREDVEAGGPERRGSNTVESLRVLLVVHDLIPGAPSVPLCAFEWMKNGVELRTVAMYGGPLEGRYRQLGSLDIAPMWQRSLRGRAQRKWSLWQLRRKVARFRPQLIYVNSIVTLQWAKQLGLTDVPVLLHIHELESYVEPVVAESGDLLRSWPKRYVVVSQAVRELLVNVVGVPAEKVGLVYEFIGDDMLSESDPPVGANDRPFVVGGAGHLSWRKGMTLWLQVAAGVRRHWPGMSVEFRWVGVDDDAGGRPVRREALKLGVADVVKFIPRTAKPLEQYREFDVFAMTSWEDPCPLVVLENMALGRPVLCFAGGGGAPEEVGDTGVIVPEFNPEMMAAEVVELAKDSARRRTLGNSARSRVERMFVASVQVPRLYEEMKRAVGIEGIDL